MSASPSKADFEAHLNAVRAAGGGVVNLQIVRPGDLPDVLEAALLGDINAKHTFNLTMRALEGVRDAPWRRPKLCACCPRAVRRGDNFSVALAAPACDAPLQAIALVICPRCGGDTVTLKQRATEALCKFWPDIHDVSPTHPNGGHA